MDDGGETGRGATSPVQDDDVAEPDDGGSAAWVGQPVQGVVVVDRAQVVRVREEQQGGMLQTEVGSGGHLGTPGYGAHVLPYGI